MAEEINKILDEHSKMPKAIPYVCASVLEEIMNKLRKAEYGTVVDVYKHAITLDLPKSFKDELEFECRKRGYNTKQKS
jgi:hypothetical protein